MSNPKSGRAKASELGELSAYERYELPSLGPADSSSSRSSAKKQAPKIKLPTAADIEKIRQAAFDEGKAEGKKSGYQEGFSKGVKDGIEQGKLQGLNQGLSEAQIQIDAKMAEISALLGSMAKPVSGQEELLGQALLNASVAIARSVIHRELTADSSVILSLTQDVLELLNDQSGAPTLKVNPLDFELVSADSSFNQAIHIVSDPTITKGGCLLESSSQLIDYTVEKRFQKTIQGMLEAAAHSVDPDANRVELHSGKAELTEYSSELLDESVVNEHHEEPESGDPADEAEGRLVQSGEGHAAEAQARSSESSDALVDSDESALTDMNIEPGATNNSSDKERAEEDIDPEETSK